MKKVVTIILIIMLVLIGCTNNQKSEEVDPDEVMTQYAEAIANKDSQTIVQLYGGDYEFMKNFSLEDERDDKEKVVENYLKVIPEKIFFDEIINKEKISDEEVEYEITYKTEDGSTFEVRDAETGSGIFKYTVKKIDGQYKVMNPPPYQP